MKRFSFLMMFFLLACSCSNTIEVANSDDVGEFYEIPNREYDSPNELKSNFSPDGYRFVEIVIGDSLNESELIHIDTIGMADVNYSERDSIYLTYLTVGNYCGFFEGFYRFEADTVFVWHHEDAYDGCGENCLFRLEYVLPKPVSDYVLWVNGGALD